MIIESRLAEDLKNIQSSPTADALWGRFAAAVAHCGVSATLAIKGHHIAPLPREAILHTNFPPPVLDRLSENGQASCPVRRYALRSVGPYLASSVRHTRRQSRACIAACPLRAALAGDDLFIVPERRNETLAGVTFLAGPASIFDPLACSVLHVLVHVAFRRAEQLERAPERERLTKLTRRELACLDLAATGASTSEIARQLRVSARTARFHLDNAREKLGVTTRKLALRKAARIGLLKTRPSSSKS